MRGIVERFLNYVLFCSLDNVTTQKKKTRKTLACRSAILMTYHVFIDCVSLVFSYSDLNAMRNQSIAIAGRLEDKMK